jgi:hypothetical protein
MNSFNGAGLIQLIPSHQISIVDVFFPGFSSISATMQQLLAGNLNSYARLLCIYGMLVFLVTYVYRYLKELGRDLLQFVTLPIVTLLSNNYKPQLSTSPIMIKYTICLSTGH